MADSTTKKTIRVTITTDVEVEITNTLLTPEALAEFSKSFYATSDPTDMFYLAAQQIVRFEPRFLEGLGACRPAHIKEAGVSVHYKEMCEEIETEEVEP